MFIAVLLFITPVGPRAGGVPAGAACHLAGSAETPGLALRRCWGRPAPRPSRSATAAPCPAGRGQRLAEPIWRRGVGGRHPPPPCAGCAPGRSPLLFPPPSWLGVALGEEEAVSGGGGAAMRQLPYFCRGEVVKGFGRGSRQLGVPTANFSEQVVESFPSDISTGIYYGWACVGNGDVHKMVLSIGWNPFYKNTKKSVETHIIHTFKEDFYGEILSIAIIGYIRPEKNFDSLGQYHRIVSFMQVICLHFLFLDNELFYLLAFELSVQCFHKLNIVMYKLVQ
uniref:Riboflavin kinase n=1 Tax=Cairina moschata TaxID=8855 RepID=A0A8C3C1D5_CAIMO